LVYPKLLKMDYESEKKVFHISFELPKGAYATVFLENIAGRNFSAEDVKKV